MDIPGYEIVELLGSGGFGTVHRARQLAVQREVALKVDSRLLSTDRDRRRFMREVTAAGRLSGHPNVVAVYDAGVLGDGRPYIVLELCPGGSLNDRLRDTGPFPAAEVRDIGVRIADALAAAHAAGVLHRDVKPANILVDRYGNVALADFGLAAMPRPGLESSATREALTPAYAPPEAFRMAEPTPAGDVYSLAAALYALLSGRPPHFPPGRQPNIAQLMAAHLRPVPDVPGAPPALTAVLRQGLAYEPGDRPPSAAAFRDALAAPDLSAAPPSVAAPSYGSVPAPSYGSVPAPSYASVPAPSTWPSVTPRSTREPMRPSSAPEPPRQPRPGVPRGVLLGAGALLAAALVGAGALIAISPWNGGGRNGGGGTGTSAGATRSPGGSTQGGSGAYGVATVAQDCPAATIAAARARCTQTAECWGGMVSIAGDTRATRYDCRVKHTWETFAIAVMPPDGETWNDSELQQNPTVKKVCSRTTLLSSRRGAGLTKPAGDWTPGVLPPSRSAFDRGVRVYRCVASLGLDGLRGSSFRPLG
ncbi:MAG TPA: protein kinase [Streptosporangiaceae bacterium]|jgi:serine/threonine protein kinase